MVVTTYKLKRLKETWSEYLSVEGRLTSVLVCAAYLTIVLIILPKFLQFVESRQGVVLEDPILNLFEPIELTWISFLIIYLSLMFAVVYFIDKPRLLHRAIATYALIVSFRIIAMYTIPLDAPKHIIILNDPFVQLFGSGKILTKDLFFSGHTSTLFMLYLITEKKSYKNLFLFSTLLVAVCVLLQHVHYTIDVLAAPFFAFAAYKIVNKFIR